jgi:hypothetical protein
MGNSFPAWPGDLFLLWEILTLKVCFGRAGPRLGAWGVLSVADTGPRVEAFSGATEGPGEGKRGH